MIDSSDVVHVDSSLTLPSSLIFVATGTTFTMLFVLDGVFALVEDAVVRVVCAGVETMTILL
jgi:hypothetical protein